MEVGDHIVCKKHDEHNYVFTKSNAVCRIKRISHHKVYDLEVSVLGYKDHPSFAVEVENDSNAFMVNSSHFRLAKKQEVNNMFAERV